MIYPFQPILEGKEFATLHLIETEIAEFPSSTSTNDLEMHPKNTPHNCWPRRPGVLPDTRKTNAHASGQYPVRGFAPIARLC